MKKEDQLTKLGSDIYSELLKGGYVKGFGDGLIRVCDKDHNPLFNAPKKDFQYLINKGVVELNEFLWTLVCELPKSETLPVWKS